MLHPVQVPPTTLQQTARHIDVVPAKILQTPTHSPQHHDRRRDPKLSQLPQVPRRPQTALDVLILLESRLPVHLLLQLGHQRRVAVDPIEDGGEPAPVGQEVETRPRDEEEGLVEALARLRVGAVVGAEAIGELVDGLATARLGEFLFEEDHEFVVRRVFVFHGICGLMLGRLWFVYMKRDR